MKYFASKELIAYCKKQVKNPDVIMDLYDQTFAWASEKVVKILGFSHEELAETRVLDLRIKSKSDEEDLMEHMAEKEYVEDMLFKTKKNKKVLVKLKVKYIEFEGHPCYVVKILKVISKEK